MRYLITVHEDSFAYEESYLAESDSPFPTMNIGDRWDSSANGDSSWSSDLKPGESYVITDIEHQIAGSNQNVIYALTKIKVEIKARENW